MILKYNSEGRLLDIGCANGYFLNTMQDNFSTYGIELNKGAAKRASIISIKSKIINKDASNLNDFKSNFFNIITAFDVLEHIRDTNKCLREIRRVLNNKGYLIVSVPNKLSLGAKLKGKKWFGYRDKTHIALYSPQEWREYFKKNNFIIKNVFYEGYFDIPYY